MKSYGSARDSLCSARSIGQGLLAAACLLVFSGGGCAKKEPPPPPPPPTVEVADVVQKDIPMYQEWVGALDGYVNAVIRPQVAGYLIKQNYREGDLVKKGQALFEIDRRTFQAALDQAQGSLEQAKGQLAQALSSVEQAKAEVARRDANHVTAKAELARVKPLAEKNAVSQKDLDDSTGRELAARASVEEAKAGVETAKAAVESAKAAIVAATANVDKAKLDLSFTRITSPIEGVAGIAKTQLGNLVGPNDAVELTTVSQLDPIKVYINVSEQEYLDFVETRRGQFENIPLELILSNGSVYSEKGKFSLSDRQVDPTTGTLKLGLLFANPNNLLRPGQYGRARAVMGTRQGALLVPQRAVTELQGNFQVAVVGPDNKVEIRPVKVAERVGALWVVTEGLKPGERVVAEGIQKVKSGSVINPKPYTPEAQPAKSAPAPDAKPAEPAKEEKR